MGEMIQRIWRDNQISLPSSTFYVREEEQIPDSIGFVCIPFESANLMTKDFHPPQHG